MNLLQQVRRSSTAPADATNHRRVHVDAVDGKAASPHEPPPIGVGAAIVLPYRRGRVPPVATVYERSEHGSESSTDPAAPLQLNSRFFLAMLAPSPDAAIAFLQLQPSGAFVLAQHEHELLVFIKFRPTIRHHVLIRAKDIKKIKEDEVVHWGRASPAASHHQDAASTSSSPASADAAATAASFASERVSSASAMTIAPVHYLQLVEDAYRHLERCWTRFLPHVQAMIFELCSESYYMDESIAQDDWSSCLMASRVPSVAFLAPETCGFFLFDTSALCGNAASSSSAAGAAAAATGDAAAASAAHHAPSHGQPPHALPVRVLEFDFARCQIALSDGSFRPSAFTFSVHLASRKKWYESDVTLAAIHENFMAPQCVRLKQASAKGSETASAFAIWDSTTDPRDDREVTQLYATLAICRAIIPGHALPDELLDAIRDLHMCFAASTATPRPSFLSDGNNKTNGINSNAAGKRYRRPPQRWASEKARVAAQLLPFYLELFLSAAASPELLHETPGRSATPPTSSSAAAASNATLLPRLVRALSSDIVHMARHVDDATVTGLVHHVLQAFVLRSRLPSAMVRLIDALFLASHHFRTLFLRAGGVSRLWNAVCAATRSRDDGAVAAATTTSAAAAGGGGASQTGTSASGSVMPVRPVPASVLQMNGDHHHADHAPTATEAQAPKTQRRSSLFGIRRKSHVRASRTVDRNSALLLSMAAHDGHASAPGDVHANAKTPLLVFVRMDPRQVQAQLASALKESHFPTPQHALPVERPVWQSMTSLVLHVAETLLSDPAALTWERDVMATLRLDGLFDRLHSELVRGSTAHVPMTTPEVDIRGRPVEALDRVTSFVSNSAAAQSPPSVAVPLSAPSLSSEPHETRLQTAIECVGALYQLEVLRRRHASTVALGEKRYWYLFHVLRSPLRDFHEHTRERLRLLASRHQQLQQQQQHHHHQQSDVPNDDHVVSLTSRDESEAFLLDEREDAKRMTSALRLLERVLPALPRAMATEFVLVSLEDLLRVANAMDAVLEQLPDAAPAFLARSRLLLNVLTVVLERTDDVDLRLLLGRAAASSGTSIPQLVLRLCQEHDDASTPLQLELLRFFHAFLVLANAVPQLNALSSAASVDDSDELGREDRDVREQRKTMLMSNVLTPGHGIVDDDELLWTVIQDVFLWDVATSSDVRPRPRLAALPIVERDAEELAAASALEVDAMSTVLAIRQCLYLSTILDGYAMSLAAGKLVQFHWKALQRLSDAVASSTAALPVAQALAVRHLECLLSLASRRTSTPSIDSALLSVRAVRSLLETLDCRAAPASSPTSERSNCNSSTTNTELQSPGRIPALDLAQLNNRTATIPSRRPSDSDSESLGVSLSRSWSVSRSVNLSLSHELLRSHPALHALAVLVVLACLIDGQRLDERLVPRYFLPPDSAASSAFDTLFIAAMPREDVLWRLQRHLEDAATPSTVHVAVRERLQRCTLLGLCGSAARADALRVLTTLVLPDSFHSALYSLPLVSTSGESPRDGRTYLAKGAFATVYRASSPFYSNTSNGGSHSSHSPAIKVLAHQRGSGDLCVAAEVFHEISVLRRLQGNAAATQLLDFGSRRDTQNFELVLECCEATLSDWRRSLATVSTTERVPFRALVRLSLEVFLALGRVLQRIHAQSICHFDVKSDNVLLRVPCGALTARILSTDAADSPRDEPLESLLCFADFGESLMDVPVDGAQLSRTRGTEAIKSPEMLRVKGDDTRQSEATAATTTSSSSRIGRASDVWSFGCLLFELLTQQLMFGGDDWAALFAHLSAENDVPSVRADHRDALLTALSPSTDDERRAVDAVAQFLESILVRDAARRPTLGVVMRNAERLLHESITTLPVSADEQLFIEAVKQALPLQPAEPELLSMAPSSGHEPAETTPVLEHNDSAAHENDEGEGEEEHEHSDNEEHEDDDDDDAHDAPRRTSQTLSHRHSQSDSQPRRLSVTALVVVLTAAQREALARLDDALRLRICPSETSFRHAIARLSPQFYMAQGVDWLGARADASPSYWGAPLRTDSLETDKRPRQQRSRRRPTRATLSELERQTEQAFHHYVYVCFDESQDRRYTSSMGAVNGSAPLLVDSSSSSTTTSSATAATRAHLRSSSFLEIVEGVRRTFVFVNRAMLRRCLRSGHRPRPSGSNSSSTGSSSSAAPNGTTHLIALLLQYSRGLLTTLHRRIRQRHERVLFVPVDLVNATRALHDDEDNDEWLNDDDEEEEDDDDDEEQEGHDHRHNGSDIAARSTSSVSPRLQQLTHFASALLLHFMVMGCGLTPLRAIATFSRECLDAVHHAPPAMILQQLQDCFLQRQALRRRAVREQWAQRQRHVLCCQCGDKVLAVPAAALAAAAPWPPAETEAWRRWQATVLSGALDDEQRRDPLALENPQLAVVAPRTWLVVDSLSVERLESQLRATLHRVLGASTATAAVAAGPPPSTHPRRSSLTTFLSRHMSPSSSSSTTAAATAERSAYEHVHHVMHGLQRVPHASHASASDKWALLACGMCGSALCAIEATAAHIALPLSPSSRIETPRQIHK